MYFALVSDMAGADAKAVHSRASGNPGSGGKADLLLWVRAFAWTNGKI
jgi:hypothetical protein